MRDRPLRVDAVAAESATQVIADAACGHPAERGRNDIARLGVVALGQPSQRILEFRRMGKLGGRAEPAVDRIEARGKMAPCAFADVGRQRPAACNRLEAAHRILQLRRLSGDRGALFAVGSRHLGQEFKESGAAVARFPGVVGAAKKRGAVRREEHGQRPAARLAGKQGMGGLVDLVEVGTLLAVDLDVDEVLVHHVRGVGVLEGLVRHHVAPVAGGITH